MSDKIIARYSSYIIPDYEITDCRQLENELSVYNARYFRREIVGFIYDEENKELRIPGGYPNRKLAKLLNRQIIEDEYPNPLDKISVKMKSKVKNDIQLQVIKFLCGLGEKFNFSRKHSQLFADLPTGDGKTFCGISAVVHIGEKAIIFTPSQIGGLALQWKEEFIKHSEITEDQILIVQGSKKCLEVLDNKHKDKSIFIVNRSTALSFAKKYGWSEFERMVQKTKAGIKIIDEMHLDFTTSVKIDCYSNVKKNIYLTATAGRGNRDEDKIFKLIFTEIPIMGGELRTAEDNYIIILVIKFSHKATTNQRISCKTRDGLSTALYSKYLIDKEGAKHEFFSAINEFFQTIVVKFKNTDGKVLILGSTRELLQTISRFLKVNYPQYSIGMYTSDIAKKEERKKELDKDIILATEKGAGTGEDITNLQIMLNTIPYSNRLYADQLPGRLRRHDGWTLIYGEILNKDFPEAVAQYNNRSKFLCKKAKNGKIITIEV